VSGSQASSFCLLPRSLTAEAKAFQGTFGCMYLVRSYLTVNILRFHYKCQPVSVSRGREVPFFLNDAVSSVYVA
jgi:hypothetical protein